MQPALPVGGIDRQDSTGTIVAFIYPEGRNCRRRRINTVNIYCMSPTFISQLIKGLYLIASVCTYPVLFGNALRIGSVPCRMYLRSALIKTHATRT